MQDVLLISLIFVFSLQNGIIFFFYVNQYSFVFLVEKNIRSVELGLKLASELRIFWYGKLIISSNHFLSSKHL